MMDGGLNGRGRDWPTGRPVVQLANLVEKKSNAFGECFRWLVIRGWLDAFERLEGPGLAQVDDGVELLRHAGVEIVALPLRFGGVDHANGPLQPPDGQHVVNRGARRKGKEKT